MHDCGLRVSEMRMLLLLFVLKKLMATSCRLDGTQTRSKGELNHGFLRSLRIMWLPLPGGLRDLPGIFHHLFLLGWRC